MTAEPTRYLVPGASRDGDSGATIVRRVLVATDLDGTLIANGGVSVGDYTAKVLKRVDAAGIPVVFVTGRPLRYMEALWPHVGQHGLAVVANGAVTYDVHARRVIEMAGIDPALGLKLTAQIAATVPGCGFAIECLGGIRLAPGFITRRQVPANTRSGPLEEIWDEPAVKLLVRHEGMDQDEFRTRVITAVGDMATTTWSGPELIEISAAGVTKASALTLLCSRLGVSADEVVAFGDMPNDLPMLAWAGTSYGMADAHESVLALVDHVAPSCEEEGVAMVLEGFIN
jgi:Cof subfamily protein (haloacid dehalogenase superfamily)